MSEKVKDLDRGPHEAWCDCFPGNNISERCNCIASSYIDQIEELERKLGVAVEAIIKVRDIRRSTLEGLAENGDLDNALIDLITVTLPKLKGDNDE